MFKYSINKIRKYAPAIFLCYGIITAIFILTSNANTYVENQMPSRVEMMQDSLDAFSGGEVPDVFSYADAQPGFYLIVSYVASASGCTDAAMVLRNCQDVFAFILFSVLPFLVYKLFVNSMWGG